MEDPKKWQRQKCKAEKKTAKIQEAVSFEKNENITLGGGGRLGISLRITSFTARTNFALHKQGSIWAIQTPSR